MRKTDKIRLFRQFFRGRQDVVPRYWRSRKTGRSGYAPICQNEWQRPMCRKGIVRFACAVCDHMAYAPVSDEMIRGHFRGEHILGIYPLLRDHTCRFVAADFDNHTGDRNPLADIRAFYEVCQVQEIPAYILRSGSGTGYHAYLFFDKPVPARKARTVFFALLREAEVISGETELASFDRLFPNQDRLSGKGLGNLIALPFQGRAAQKGHTLFLNPATGFSEPYQDQWTFLSDIDRISEKMLDALKAEWQLAEPEDTESRTRQSDFTDRVIWSPDFSTAPDFEQIARNCAFIAHCRDDAQVLPEPDWYVLLSISARCRDGHRLSHRLSETYPGYTYEETEAKIRRALTCTGPYLCRTIEKISGKYCRDCHHYRRVKSPILLGRLTYGYAASQKTGWEVSDSEAGYLPHIGTIAVSEEVRSSCLLA